MAFSCCVRRSIRSLGPPIEHGRAIFHRRLLSTNAIAVIESAFDKAVPSPKDPEVSLVPNGFPFSVTSSLCDITLIREDQVERMEASILASRCWVEDGNPSVKMLVRCYRGYMVTHIEAILKPDSIRICKARIREHRNGHLEAFEEFLGSKGIDGEKLLGSLGGMFSKTWKPKKGRPIRGPVISRDESLKRRGNHLEQREKLGLNPAPKPRSSTRTPPPESAVAFQRVEFEKGKQDDALSRKSPPESSLKSSRKTSSEPNLAAPDFGTNPFDDHHEKAQASSSSSYSLYSSARNKYKNDFRDDGGLENQSVQELENYAVYKAEETTKAVNGALKIAEEIREDATKTLITLHHQGEQITRNHNVTVEIDQDLSRGEKLLGSLGGMFSKTWKPKKGRPIRGPVISRDDSPKRRGNHLEQREKLGLNPAPKPRSSTRTPPPESADAFQKVEFEKGKQDDALSDLSNLLGELKDMAVDMGTEIDRHTKALDHFEDDVDELNVRVKGANLRGRRLLGK